MYFQFSKLTLILLFSAHFSIFSSTLYYLPVLTAAGTTSNLTSSVNCIIMLVFQFQIICVNFKEDGTLNRALWHPYSQLIQLNILLFIIKFCLCSMCLFSVHVMELTSKPIVTRLKSKISSDVVLNAIPKPRWYPLSFLNAFVTVPQKIINISTAQFSLHKSRLLIDHGSIIFLSALCQFRIKPCIKLYIAWDLAAGKWQGLTGTWWSAWTDCNDLHGGAVFCYKSSL